MKMQSGNDEKRSSLSVSMQESLRDDAADILCNISEIGLDSILDDGIIKDIPMISTAVRLFNIGKSIKERHYVKKLAIFIDALNKGMAKDEQREYYKQKVIDDTKKRNKELEYILILIDRYLLEDKTVFLAKIYLAYLDETIKWEEFVTFSSVIDMLMPKDYTVLKSSYTYHIRHDNNTDSILRLAGLGLIVRDPDALDKIDRRASFTKKGYASSLNKDRIQNTYYRTALGDKMVKILESR